MECERTWSVRLRKYRLGGEATHHCGRNGDPLVGAFVLPAHERQPAAAANIRSDVRERSRGVGEEHHAEPREHRVGWLIGRSDSFGLCVGDHERCLRVSGRGSACGVDHGAGDVGANDPTRWSYRVCNGKCCSAGAAADIEYVFAGLRAERAERGLAEVAQHVIEHRLLCHPLRTGRLGPIRGLLLIGGVLVHRPSVSRGAIGWPRIARQAIAAIAAKRLCCESMAFVGFV